jgi:hypothetical protein
VLLIELAILGIEDIEAERDAIIFGLRRLGADITELKGASTTAERGATAA